jgi:transcriptional regulator with XRE-family HTH domain
MPRADRHTELADFLRTRRQRLTPEDVGLPVGARRRTTGLRREEVALLADIGITWYTWLEQGRPINVSTQVLARLAQTLRLTPAETSYLYVLAQRSLPASGACEEVTPGMQAVLDALEYVPAFASNACWDVLAWNRPAGCVFQAYTLLPAEERNFLWLLTQYLLPGTEQQVLIRQAVAQFRANYAQHSEDPRFPRLIERCRQHSALFREIWAQHDVLEQQPLALSYEHPKVGLLRFSAPSFQASDAPDLHLVLFTPMPDTGTAAGIEQLLYTEKIRETPALATRSRLARVSA